MGADSTNNVGLNGRKSDFVACEQKRGRPACASTQSDQRLCYSLYGKENSPTGSKQNFIILASLCS